MKPVIILVCLTFYSLSIFAQTGKRKSAARQINHSAGNTGYLSDDSMLVVKKKPPTVQTANAKSRTAPQRVSNTKLDDLKNPFDTLRSAQPRTVVTPRKTATMKTRKTPKQQILGDSLNIKRPPAVIQKQN